MVSERQAARELCAAVVSAAILVTLAYAVAGALHPPRTILPSGLRVFDVAPSLDALERAFELGGLERKLGNSLLVVVIAVPVSLVVASWTAFAMTQLEPRARRAAVGIVLVLLVVPAPALWVPRFLAFDAVGVTDTLVPLVAPALMGTTPFAVLLFYWSFRRIDDEMLDAARLEGLGAFGVWRRVAAPLVEPTTLAVAMVVFLAHWSNLVDPLLYLFSPERFTLPLGVSQLRLLGVGDTSTVLAGALVMTVPAALVFAAAQRRFLAATREAGWLGS